MNTPATQPDVDIPGRSPTVKEIARVARVSNNTVYLSLRDDARVHEDTRKRIRAVATELGYRTNAAARALSSKTVPYFGLINAYSDVAGSSVSATDLMRAKASLIVALGQCLEDRGYHLLQASGDPCVSSDHGEPSPPLPKLLQQRHVSGVFVFNHIWPALYEAVARWDVPCVAIDTRALSGIPVLSIDQTHGTTTAVNHLLELGHQRIAFLPGSQSSPDVKEKTTNKAMGYASAMHKAGLDLMPGWDEKVQGPHTHAVSTVLAPMLRTTKPTAVLTYDDTVAYQAIRYLQDQGLRVPQDISVVSLEDNNIADLFNPAITGISCPAQDLGAKGVEAMLNLVEGKPIEHEHTLIRPQLVIRQSTTKPSDR